MVQNYTSEIYNPVRNRGIYVHLFLGYRLYIHYAYVYVYMYLDTPMFTYIYATQEDVREISTSQTVGTHRMKASTRGPVQFEFPESEVSHWGAQERGATRRAASAWRTSPAAPRHSAVGVPPTSPRRSPSVGSSYAPSVSEPWSNIGPLA